MKKEKQELQPKVLAKSFLTSIDFQRAIDSQNACNLSGIVFEFARMMEKICMESSARNLGTAFKNSHPIARLYSEQIMHLAACPYNEAHDKCEESAA